MMRRWGAIPRGAEWDRRAAAAAAKSGPSADLALARPMLYPRVDIFRMDDT
jgi:hypothetical protein